MTVFQATYDSRNFSFAAVGTTKTHARQALITGLLKHAQQYNLPRDWFERGDIDVREYRIGSTYRDGGEIL